ncbi:MAG: hypothetical protein Q8P28_11455, partial [Deltaproteobacteria bacterium]|nr:hypothetical protein [Deltaproteobacteria bacterium]
QVSVQFVKDQLVEDSDWADQVYIGIMKNIERGFLHGAKIIDKEDIPASQKGATANLLKAIIEAAEDLYGGMIPQFKKEDKGKPGGNTYNWIINVTSEKSKELVDRIGNRLNGD